MRLEEQPDGAQRGGGRGDNRVGGDLRSVFRRLLPADRRLLRGGPDRSGSGGRTAARCPTRPLDLAIAAATCHRVVGLAYVIEVAGVTEVRPLGLRVELSMHAPVLVLMLMVIARIVVRTRPALEIRWPMPPAESYRRAAVIAAAATTVLLSPVLYTLFHPPRRRRRAARPDLLAQRTERRRSARAVHAESERASCSARRRVPG